MNYFLAMLAWLAFLSWMVSMRDDDIKAAVFLALLAIAVRPIAKYVKP